MGLLTAYISNVRKRRGAELAFALNQREVAEAKKAAEIAEQERMWRSVNDGSFADSLARAWNDDGGMGGTWSPAMPSSAFTQYPPAAPEPPPMRSAPPRQVSGQSESLSRVLERMKSTSGRMSGGPGILGGAARPAPRVR